MIQNGAIEPTEAPGRGLELDEDVVLRHRHAKGGIPFFAAGGVRV